MLTSGYREHVMMNPVW